MWRSIWLSCALTLSITSACFPPDDGVDPPLDRIYFPVGVALSSGADRLYVANSDFDLQYNAGTLQALDAAAIRALRPVPCLQDGSCERGTCNPQGLCESGGSVCPGGKDAEQSSAESFLVPGLCQHADLNDGLLLESVRIAPFVSDLTYKVFKDSKGKERARLFLPVRSDATVHWADVAHDQAGTGPVLDCGQSGPLAECDANHRRGDEADERSVEREHLPTEPFGLSISTDGRAIVVAHQTQGAVSLFENTDSGPKLQSILRGLPVNPMAIAAVPPPRLAEVDGIDYQPGFLVTFRQGGVNQIELLRYFDKNEASHTPFLQRAGSAPITVATGFDARGIAVDNSARALCEEACACPEDVSAAAEDCRECLEGCASVQLEVFVANRSPDSLMIGTTNPANTPTRSDDLPNLSEMEPLRGGPSKVWVGNIINEADPEAASPKLERRVFAIAFDARWFYIYDPARRAMEVRLTTGRGPQGIAIDEKNGLAYIAHFTDSYISVVDLNKAHTTYGKVLLNVGQPKPPRAEQ